MVSTSSVQAALSVTGLLALQAPTEVKSHAYLMAPVSRQFWFTPVFQSWSFPDMEYCPHCYQSRGNAAVRARGEALTDPGILAQFGAGRWPHYSSYQIGLLAENGNYLETDDIAVRHGVCGDPEQTVAEGTNKYGKANSNYPVLETFEEGSVIETKVVMSTWHYGHLEFFICNAEDLAGGPDSAVTQGCFNMHPLDRAADDGDASPIDPNHRGRYFVDPPCHAAETDQTKPEGAATGDVVTARYQLPEGLTCDRCILQMVYYTGNSCKHPGYEEFNPPSWPSECAPNKADWITTDPPLCGIGDSYPEEFWNCADIAITPNGSPRPTPEPTMTSPTTASIPAPTREPTSGATPEPTTTAAPGIPTHHPTHYPSSSPTLPLRTSEPGATFAPHASEAPQQQEPSFECGEEIDAYEQCGGEGFEGTGCCRMGYECVQRTDCYSECRPIDVEEINCSDSWEQCGGIDWTGPKCCEDGNDCVERNQWYSQCIPV